MDAIRKIDVLIVGGGPSGAVCGCLLKRAGVDCVIVDRATFPRDKICGGGLMYKAWRLLDELLPDFHYNYSPINHIRLQFDDDTPSQVEMEHEIRMTSRKEFDHALLRHYQQAAGGEVVTDAFVSYEELPDGQLMATFSSGLRIQCRYLVAADGVHSRVCRQVLGKRREDNVLFLEQYTGQSGSKEIFVHFSRDYYPGTFYLFPSVGRDIWGYMGPVTDRETFQRLLKRYDVPSGRLVGGYVPTKAVQSTHEHIILIGDAGGFTNRITGEGLYDAFKTAYNAKEAIVRGVPFSQTNRKVFAKMHTQERLLRLAHASLFQRCFRWVIRHPRLTKLLFDAKNKRETWLPRALRT